MFSVSQGSIENKDSDVSTKKELQKEAENSDVSKKRRVNNKDDEVSDHSHNSGWVIQLSLKNPKVDYNNGSTSYKGVVLQPTGNWGAQIYVNHQRFWLGTFNSELEAAMAYDSASLKVRGNVDSHRNLPITNITIHEPDFQSQFSTEVVFNMIKDGFYMSKFYDYLKEKSLVDQKPWTHKGEGFFCKKLFQKELTPSDVSSLNRLVIPKKYAVTHLHGTLEGESMDSEIVCFDRLNTEWKFRFCYWKSSQSFVLTRGWNAFIKAKTLKAKDTLTFFCCQCPTEKTTSTRLIPAFGIDVEYCNALQSKDELRNDLEKEKDLLEKDSNGSGNQGGLRLFGVQII